MKRFIDRLQQNDESKGIEKSFITTTRDQGNTSLFLRAPYIDGRLA